MNVPQLKAISLFKTLPDASLAFFAKHTLMKRYEKNAPILLQGGDALSCFVVIDGWVKLNRTTQNGQESIIALCSNGDIFGQTSLFQGSKWLYGAEVLDEAMLLEIPASVLRQHIRENGEVALNLFDALSGYIANLELQVEHFAVMTAPQRVACFFLRLCRHQESSRYSFTLPYDKTIIASYLGIQRETFSRTLKRLQEMDIQVDGSRVTINNVEALRDYVCTNCSIPSDCVAPCSSSCS